MIVEEMQNFPGPLSEYPYILIESNRKVTIHKSIVFLTGYKFLIRGGGIAGYEQIATR